MIQLLLRCELIEDSIKVKHFLPFLWDLDPESDKAYDIYFLLGAMTILLSGCWLLSISAFSIGRILTNTEIVAILRYHNLQYNSKLIKTKYIQILSFHIECAIVLLHWKLGASIIELVH